MPDPQTPSLLRNILDPAVVEDIQKIEKSVEDALSEPWKEPKTKAEIADQNAYDALSNANYYLSKLEVAMVILGTHVNIYNKAANKPLDAEDNDEPWDYSPTRDGINLARGDLWHIRNNLKEKKTSNKNPHSKRSRS